MDGDDKGGCEGRKVGMARGEWMLLVSMQVCLKHAECQGDGAGVSEKKRITGWGMYVGL